MLEALPEHHIHKPSISLSIPPTLRHVLKTPCKPLPPQKTHSSKRSAHLATPKDESPCLEEGLEPVEGLVGFVRQVPPKQDCEDERARPCCNEQRSPNLVGPQFVDLFLDVSNCPEHATFAIGLPPPCCFPDLLRGVDDVKAGLH